MKNTNTNKTFKKNSRPKKLSIQMNRNTDGTYKIVDCKYLKVVNQYESYWADVPVGEVYRELKSGAIV